jgi:hypothetical protein
VTVRMGAMDPSAQGVIRDVTRPGVAAFGIAVATLTTPFVIGRVVDTSPMWIFLVGSALGISGILLGARVVRAPKGSPGRGMGWTAIVIGSIGIGFCLFAWAAVSIVLNDTTL